VEADTVEISGRVRDRTVIRARSLEVSLNVQKGGMQVVFGECELAVGDEPNKDAAIASAMTAPAADAKAAAAAAPAKPNAAADADGKRRRPPGTEPPSPT